MRKDDLDIFIVQPSGEVLANKLKQVFTNLQIHFFPTDQVQDIPYETWQACNILYTERAIPLPEQVPNLKWIQFHYAGINHVLNEPLMKTPGLLVTTLSGVPSMPMGEYVIMAMLTLGHRLSEIRGYQERKQWPENRFNVLSPIELRNSTVGIIGYGSSGRQVARLSKAFGAKVLAVKRDVHQMKDNGYCPDGTGDPLGEFVDQIYSTDQLCEMLSLSDYVVVTVPLTKSSYRMLGMKELLSIKKGAYLIDISRGGIIDHEALYGVLNSGHLSGAMLDVFPTEPLSADNPMWDCPNVIITPHISGYSPNYFEDSFLLFKKNIELFLAGKPLLNEFAREFGY